VGHWTGCSSPPRKRPPLHVVSFLLIPRPGTNRMPGKLAASLTTLDHKKGDIAAPAAIALAVARKLRRLSWLLRSDLAHDQVQVGVFADAPSLPLFGGGAVFSLGDP
jgi:hypothetical protein